MSPSNSGWKHPNFPILNSLFTLLVSPLPRLPGYSRGYPGSCLESSWADCSAGYPERNPENCLDRSSISNLEGCLERNSVSCSEGCGDRRSAGCSAERPANRSAGNSESNLPSNQENCPENSRESCWADRTPGDVRNLRYSRQHEAGVPKDSRRIAELELGPRLRPGRASCRRL